MAKTPPNNAPAKIVTKGGTRNTARPKTRMSGDNAHGVITKCWLRPDSIAEASKSPGRPKRAKPTTERPNAGTDVHRVSRICSNKSEPAAAVARFTVSDSGDVLSPKYAPEMTAPAVIAGDNPMLVATPINPMPIVPATVHELPIPTATPAQISAVAAYKSCGLRIC